MSKRLLSVLGALTVACSSAAGEPAPSSEPGATAAQAPAPSAPEPSAPDRTEPDDTEPARTEPDPNAPKQGEADRHGAPGPAEPGSRASERGSVELSVRELGGRCGDNTLGVPPREPVVHARAGERGIRVELDDYAYYCAPRPRFVARRTGDLITLELLPIRNHRSVARCTCYHRLGLQVGAVPPGTYRLRVEAQGKEVVRRDGRLQEVPRSLETTVTVPASGAPR
jgi:hypothetical protein